MTVEDIIRSRGISELVHFTTNRGMVGILASRFLKARARLKEDEYLEHIYLENCPDRSRDEEWHGHVSLSISRINPRLFRSSGRWHDAKGGWWYIVSLDPSIASHPSVVFTTTNNMYTNGVQRNEGPAGLEALFASRVMHWPGKFVDRPSDLHKSQPTCIQAEVLYPGDIPLSYVQRVYAKEDHHLDVLYSIFAAVTLDPIPCEVQPELFG